MWKEIVSRSSLPELGHLVVLCDYADDVPFYVVGRLIKDIRINVENDASEQVVWETMDEHGDAQHWAVSVFSHYLPIEECSAMPIAGGAEGGSKLNDSTEGFDGRPAIEEATGSD